MTTPARGVLGLLLLATATALLTLAVRQVGTTPRRVADPVAIHVDWADVQGVSQATASVQVVPNPLFARDAPTHRSIFDALAALAPEQVRFVAWMPHPRLAVAALEPPGPDGTSWDFSRIDPLVVDFMTAMHGRSVMMNFSTIPQWMFVTPERVDAPTDPGTITWSYSRGTELRDPSLAELGGYFARVVGWYTRGGFVDELGRTHTSPYRYHFDYWEVLNEPNGEHLMTAPQYTARYDAIVEAIHAVNPDLRFAGPALAFPAHNLAFFEYFLDPAHHREGVPLDMLTYHFYAMDSPAGTGCPSPMFAQTDAFAVAVRQINALRDRLRPGLPTAINEIGALSAEEFRHQSEPGFRGTPLPGSWWNVSAAVFAHQYAVLAGLGIQVVGESALAQYPGIFSSVSLVDWETGLPNARYWVVKLLRDHFGPGDDLPATTTTSPQIYAQAFASPRRGRRLLIVNRCPHPADVTLPAAPSHRAEVVEGAGALDASAERILGPGESLHLGRYAVAAVDLTDGSGE